jgi:hypothetical protein
MHQGWESCCKGPAEAASRFFRSGSRAASLGCAKIQPQHHNNVARTNSQGINVCFDVLNAVTSKPDKRQRTK